MKPGEYADMRQFHARVRIIANLDDSAFPESERDVNPTTWELWKRGRVSGRILAFIRAPDKVATSIWQAVVQYEKRNSG